MHKNILSNIILFVSLVVISSGDRLTLPTNYTWPLNAQNLCFAARFDLKLNVAYTKNDSSNATVTIPLNNATFQSYSVSCGGFSKVHELMIMIFDGFSSLIFTFTVDDKNVTSLTKVSGYLLVNDQQSFITDYSASTAGLHKFSANESIFESARDHSFRCDSKTQITGINTNGTLSITSIDIEDLQIQAFIDDSQTFVKYGDEIYCKADEDKNSNVVPIVVGSCLAALVIIVLVAYIIGRQRNRHGYQTV